MISRRRWLAVTGAALLGPVIADAQQAGKVYRLGMLAPSPRAARTEFFFQTLRELGYVEGQNLLVEYRHGPFERLPELAAELIRLKIDVLVSVAPQATRAAKESTTTIPVVFIASDPVAAGIVASLARPGGNLTGVSFEAGLEIYGKQVEMLKQVVPSLSRVIVPPYQTPLQGPLIPQAIASASQALGAKVEFLQGRGYAEIEKAFNTLPRLRGDAVLVPPDPFFFTDLKWIVDLVAKRRLPAVYTAREFVALGGLMAYGPDLPALYRRLAVYVDKVLKGANPGDLPIEQPTKFTLAVNLKTAKVLGLTIPPSLVLRADETIQ